MLLAIGRRTALKALGVASAIGIASSSASAATGPRGGQSRLQQRHGVERDRIRVEIDEEAIPGWRSITIPGSQTEEGEYSEGEEPDYENTIWGRTTFDDLRMEREFDPDESSLYDWREEVRMGNVDDGLKELVVSLLDGDGEPIVSWQFSQAWVKEYDPPELNSSTDSDVPTESITVDYENMEREEV